MKKTYVRITSLILICLMLLSVFIACGNKKPTENTCETEADENPNIPAKDYGGYEFAFLVELTNIKPQIVSDGETGDVLNDAVYRRNELVEKKYNVKIKEVNFPSVLDEARNQSKSGDITFDAIIAGGETLAKLSLENLLCNLLEIDRFDFDASYWDKNATEQLAIDGKLYFTNCAFNCDQIGDVLFFNKEIIKEYNLTSPFEYMKNNEWTVDNLTKLAKSVSKDLDKDGSITHLDRVGIAFDHDVTYNMLYSSEVKGITLDEKGYPNLTLMSDRDKTVGIYNKIKEVFANTNYSYCIDCSTLGCNGVNDSDNTMHGLTKWEYIRTFFVKDRFLFLECNVKYISEFSKMKSEYGIAPLPMYDKNQENYYSVGDSYYFIALPKEVKDLDRAATIIEDLNYQSSITIVPVWCDSILAKGNLKCKDSRNALEAIKENTIYDLSLYYDFGGIRTKVLSIDPAKDDIDKLYNMWEKSINSGISKAVNALRKDNGQ